MAKRAHRSCLRSVAPAIVCAALFGAAIFAAGCGDDDIDRTPKISAGNTDTGATSDTTPDADAASEDVDVIDERCEGLQSGARCEMQHASGVCVDHRCQFLSCASGFRDCDENADNGCETDVTTAAECGACGVSCSAPERCQRSSVGFVCSVSPVCPDSRYDLDGERENGCEWAAEWGEDGTLDPVSTRPDVAVELTSGAFSVAGRSQDARLVLTTDPAPNASAEPIATDFEPGVRARAIAELNASDSTALVAVAWSDAITLSEAGGSRADDGIFRHACDEIRSEFNDIAARGDSPVFATTSREVLAIAHGPGCADDAAAASAPRQLCETPSAVFGLSDYVAAFATELDPSTCEACLPDTQTCPEFRPIGLDLLDANRLVVFTRRGFFMLEASDAAIDAGFVAGARLETDETGQGATRYVAGAALEDNETIRIYLLTTEGVLRRFVVDETGGQPSIAPGGPDVRLLVSANDPARLVAGVDHTLLIHDARNAWLVHPLERSARIEQLSQPDVFLGDERIVFGAGVSSPPADEFSLLYHGVGRFYLRHVVRDAVQSEP